VLERSGFQVIVARNGTQAIDLAIEKKPQIILLDLSLPDIDGLAVCAQIRETLSVPIIMVTANSRRETAMRALDAGADDYLVKPVESDELLARVRAVLRRTSNSAALPEGSPSIQVGDLHIDFNQRLVSVKGNAVRLTPTEFKLLYVLADNAGRVLSHSQLLSAVWGPEYVEEKEYLWVHINRLRKKLEDDPANPQFILTEPSIGYHLPESTSWERTGLA
jgi:two-component system KDP operon response regulator KdpE